MERNWECIKQYEEILFDFWNGIARITINRPRYRNAFTPLTVAEMSDALRYCREAQEVCVVVLTGAGDTAFCAGGDMHVKGRGGYVGGDGVPRLNVLDVQKQIRSLPKPVIAMVNGFAIGGAPTGGHNHNAAHEALHLYQHSQFVCRLHVFLCRHIGMEADKVKAQPFQIGNHIAVEGDLLAGVHRLRIVAMLAYPAQVIRLAIQAQLHPLCQQATYAKVPAKQFLPTGNLQRILFWIFRTP